MRLREQRRDRGGREKAGGVTWQLAASSTPGLCLFSVPVHKQLCSKVLPTKGSVRISALQVSQKGHYRCLWKLSAMVSLKSGLLYVLQDLPSAWMSLALHLKYTRVTVALGMEGIPQRNLVNVMPFLTSEYPTEDLDT